MKKVSERLVDEEPSIAQMRRELADFGWVQRNLTTYMAPNGLWYRGPFLAWKVMKQMTADSMKD